MANLRFAVALQRMLPAFGYHHLMMIFVACAATVTAVLLAGAGSSSIAQRVYLVQLSYINSKEPPTVPPGAWENISIPAFDAVKDTNLRVRVGYFGVCAAQDADFWICRGSASSLMASHRFIDPLGITTMADKVKSDVVLPGLFLGGAGLALICLVLLNMFPGWHEERDMTTGSDVDVKPFPSRILFMTCLGCSGLATLFTFTGALWQHTASAAAATVLETSALSVIKAGVGTVGTALAWLAFGLWMIVFIQAIIMYLSILILDRLIDD